MVQKGPKRSKMVKKRENWLKKMEINWNIVRKRLEMSVELGLMMSERCDMIGVRSDKV